MTDEPCFILVCLHHSCRDRKSLAVLHAFQDAYLPERTIAIAAECQGQCSLGPTVRVTPEEIWYCQVSPEDVPKIAKNHLWQGKPVVHKLHPRFHPPS